MCPLRRVTALRLMGLCASLTYACTDYKPASDTLESVEGNPLFSGESAVDGFGGDWSCLGTERAPTPVPGALGPSIVYSLRLIDLATGNAMSDATVRACGLTDVNCDAPVTDTIEVDEDGWANVPLTANFRGYLEIESPTAVPYLMPLPDNGLRTMRDFPMAMISLQSFGALLSALRLESNPNLGAIGMRAFDCRGQPAEGVVMRSSTGGLPWYFEDGLPNTERDMTDAQGLGGYVGSAPGVTLFETELSDGTPMSSKSLIVRAGWMTAGYMRPPNGITP